MVDEEARRDKPALGSTPKKESDPRVRAEILRTKYKQLKSVGQNFTGEETMSWLVKMDDDSISAEETIVPGKLLDASQLTMPLLLDMLFDNLERYSFEFNKRNEDFSINCLRPEGYQEYVDHFNRKKVRYMRGHLSSDDFSMVLHATDNAVEIFIIPTDFLMGFDAEESDFPSFLTLEKLSVQESSSWGINRTKISFDEFPRLCRRLLTQLVKVTKGEAISTEKFSFSATPVEEKTEAPDRTFEELDDEISLHPGEQLPSQPKQSDAEKLKEIKESLMTKVPMPRAHSQPKEQVSTEAASAPEQQPVRSTASGAYARPLASLAAKSSTSSGDHDTVSGMEGVRSQSEPGTIAKPKLDDSLSRQAPVSHEAPVSREAPAPEPEPKVSEEVKQEPVRERERERELVHEPVQEREQEPEPARKETVSAMSAVGLSSASSSSASGASTSMPTSSSSTPSSSTEASSAPSAQSASALASSTSSTPSTPSTSPTESKSFSSSSMSESSSSVKSTASSSAVSAELSKTSISSSRSSSSETESDTDSGLFYKLEPDEINSKYGVESKGMDKEKDYSKSKLSSRRKSLRGSSSESESRLRSKERSGAGGSSRLKDRIHLGDKHTEPLSNIGSDLDKIKQQVDDAQETVVDACCVIISGIDEALAALQEVGVNAMKTDNVDRVTEVMDESRRLRNIKEKLVNVADDISEV